MATQTTQVDLKPLIKRRALIKSHITKLTKFFSTKSDSQDYLSQLKLRLSKVLPLFQEFSDVQLEIELISDEDAEDETERNAFENSYYSIVSQVENYIEGKAHTNNSSIIAESQASPHPSGVKLPVIALPTFSGSYQEYPSFVETFRSLVDNNPSLQKAQRFHYLLNSLKKEAHNLVSALDITHDNYDRAWQMLTDRYDNKRLAVLSQIEQLFTLATVGKENQESLRALVDTVNKILRNLQSLSIPTESWDPILVYLISSKVDINTRREWEKQSCSREIPTFSSLLDFLNSRCQILEQMNSSKTQNTRIHNSLMESSNKGHNRFNSFHSRSYGSSETENVPCSICNDKNHLVYRCAKWLSLSQPERLKEVKISKLCINCLKPNHLVVNCRASTCRKCSKRHHTLLHIDTNTNADIRPVEQSTAAIVTQNPVTSSIVTTSNCSSVPANVLLSTALVIVFDAFDKPIRARILLDSGSQSNFCSRAFSKRLGINRTPSSTSVTGIGQALVNCNESVTFTMKSMHSSFRRQMTCFILHTISNNLPHINIKVSDLNVPSNIQLADPEFGVSAPIDILIGADLFWQSLLTGQVDSHDNHLVYRETQFGWIVSGSFPEQSVAHPQIVCNFSNEVLQEQLEKFWKMDELSSDDNVSHKLSLEDSYCENLFVQTTTKSESGRFIVHLPFRENLSQLGLSKSIAQRRFHTLENKLKTNPSLKQQYLEFMSEYIRLGHMSLDTDSVDSNEQYYLPHHAVLREASLTSKIRVVFDGSCKTTSSLSLNDVIMRGPKLQQDLFGILLRFRTHCYVVSGDISKMFRQILVHEPHRKFQKILWRSDTNQPIETYKLNTITYGIVCSPFLSIRTLHEIAKQNEETFPEASRAILSDVFVDDLLACDDSLENLIKIKDDIIYLLNKNGFELHKWTSNHPVLLQNIPNQHSIADKSNERKILGLLWNTKLDTLNYETIHVNNNQRFSKRNVLSIISQIYDPLGIISPCIVLAKLIMQELWKLNINWDEVIPDTLHGTWIIFLSELNYILKLTVPRNTTLSNCSSLELHGFADSSEKALGACIYIKSVDTYGNHVVHLLCSKSRVAPLKRVSLPRLELSAALLLAQLGQKVRTHSTLNFKRFYWWSDSVIVLSWINKTSGTWKSFVANRVSSIQSLTNVVDWHHVDSKSNPADIISRGCLPKILKNNSLWFQGPTWLSANTEYYPKQNWKPVENLEMAKPKQVFLACPTDSIINKYSSYMKLIKIHAYCLRFVYNCRHPRNKTTNTLSSDEIEASTLSLVKIVQMYSFAKEIHILRNHKTVPKNSKLITLTPFLDDQNILRVGGRLRNANLSYNQKHPILLPHDSNFTTLLVQREHIRSLHAGVQSTIASIRIKFWPLALKGLVKRLIFNCIICKKTSPAPIKYLMGNLPLHRVTPSRVFENCGVDYCGPFCATDFRRRGNVAHKVYIATFVCFATRAVHLELVTELSTAAFMAAFKRFIARRGICANLYSDNGSNFVGASREIRDLMKSNEFKNELSKFNELGITWHFIPPRTPHFGGLWERSVRSIKHHLKRVIGNFSFTYEEISTLLAQVEAVLNSRPISPLSNDPNDLQALTPGHFLVGQALTTLPTPAVMEKPRNLLKRWQHIQYMLSHFWRRWQREYLHTLQQRNKWCTSEPNVHIGSLVLIKEQGLLPSMWKMGRIVQLHPGSDQAVRVVSVKTCDGIVKRSVRNLSLLLEDAVK